MFLLWTELCGEGRWFGADWRVGARGVWSGGQDETRPKWRNNGSKGEFMQAYASQTHVGNIALIKCLNSTEMGKI